MKKRVSKVEEQPGIILWFYSVYRGEENGVVNLKELGKMDPPDLPLPFPSNL